MKMMLALFCLALLTAAPALAQRDIEQEFYTITRHLRCLTCDGQSVHESNSIFAENIKSLVLERLQQGQSQQEIEAFLQDRFGDAILMTPPSSGPHIFLWLAPFLMALAVVASLYLVYWKGKKPHEL